MNITELTNRLVTLDRKFDLRVLQIYAILELVKAVRDLTKEIKRQ